MQCTSMHLVPTSPSTTLASTSLNLTHASTTHRQSTECALQMESPCVWQGTAYAAIPTDTPRPIGVVAGTTPGGFANAVDSQRALLV